MILTDENDIILGTDGAGVFAKDTLWRIANVRRRKKIKRREAMNDEKNLPPCQQDIYMS